MTLEELKVVITALTQLFKQGMNEVKQQSQSAANSVKNSFGGLKSVFANVAKWVAAAFSVRAIINFGKAAVEAASDLAEVQNVVDVAFGSAAGEIDAFAKTAITQLGMSETTAKRMASTFMAMSNGMGVVADTGKVMAVELTTLAGDMASFYNVSLDVAETALKSVYTGETESLKKFGVVMTEANLEQFAFSQGITKSYKEMSLAEKVALRYQYVMSATANAQGDFARTSDSWANQTRILSMQFELLKATMGQGIMQALTPVIKIINTLISKLITLSLAFNKVFGVSSITSNAAASSEDMEVATGGTADNMEDAATAAKNMAKATSGIDELNVLNQDSGSGSNASSGGAGGLMDVGALEINEEETGSQFDSIIEKAKAFVDKIKGIFKDAFENMPKLEFNFDGEQALKDIDNILTNIAKTTARVLATITRLVIKIANDLNIGKLANDLLSLVASITALVDQIDSVVTPAIERLYDEALSPIVEWIGTKLSDAIQFVKTEIDNFTLFIAANEEEFNAWINVISTVIQWIWKILEPILNTAWSDFKVIVHALVEDFKTWFKFALDLGEVLEAIFEGDWNKAGEKLGEAFSNLWENILSVWEGLLDLQIFQWFADLWEGIKEIWSTVATWFDENVIQPLVNFFSPIVEVIGTIFEGLWLIIRAIWEIVSTWFNENVIQPIVEFFRPIVETIGGFFKELWDAVVKVWEVVSNWFYKNVIEPVRLAFEAVCNAIGGFFEKLWDEIKDGVVTAFNAVIGGIEKALNFIVHALNFFIEGFNSIVQWAADILGEDWSGLTLIADVQLGRIPKLAKGGILNAGQLFVANEAGPELVGRYGNQSAVMNNDQIVSAVSEGVYNAVKSAMGNGQNVQVFLDGRQIESSVRSTYQQRGAVIASGGLLDYSFA